LNDGRELKLIKAYSDKKDKSSMDDKTKAAFFEREDNFTIKFSDMELNFNMQPNLTEQLPSKADDSDSAIGLYKKFFEMYGGRYGHSY
jgi:hypothetical protein